MLSDVKKVRKTELNRKDGKMRKFAQFVPKFSLVDGECLTAKGNAINNGRCGTNVSNDLSSRNLDIVGIGLAEVSSHWNDNDWIPPINASP